MDKITSDLFFPLWNNRGECCGDNGVIVLRDTVVAARPNGETYTTARGRLIKPNNTFTKHLVLYSTLGNSLFLPAMWTSQNNISHSDQLEQEHASVK